METFEVETGDIVRHKSSVMNGGLEMNVLDTNDNQALVDYFDTQAVNKQMWIDKKELEIIYKNDGGFRNPGE